MRERERHGVKKNASDVILITMHNKIIFFYLALINSAYL